MSRYQLAVARALRDPDGEVRLQAAEAEAQLDFGAGVLNGDALWLEVAVRPGDSTDITSEPVTFVPGSFFEPMNLTAWN